MSAVPGNSKSDLYTNLQLGLDSPSTVPKNDDIDPGNLPSDATMPGMSLNCLITACLSMSSS
eukprot:6202096-Karenia_brevis.AAC.1